MDTSKKIAETHRRLPGFRENGAAADGGRGKRGWRVVPGKRKLRLGVGSADLTLFCPDLALSVPIPNRKVTARLAFIPTRVGCYSRSTRGGPPRPVFPSSPCCPIASLLTLSHAGSRPCLCAREWRRETLASHLVKGCDHFNLFKM